jgi:hypothetical protein
VYCASVRYVFFILVRFFKESKRLLLCGTGKKYVRAKKFFFEVCPIGRKILTRQPLQDESSERGLTISFLCSGNRTWKDIGTSFV